MQVESSFPMSLHIDSYLFMENCRTRRAGEMHDFPTKKSKLSACKAVNENDHFNEPNQQSLK
jgi:hypothetical protein